MLDSPNLRKKTKVPFPINTQGLPQLNSSIGSSPRSGLQEERREQLAKEFHQIDTDHNNFLSYEEIYTFLSERQGEPFDENLCRDLFDRMDKNKDNQISLEEFVDSYTDTEEIIQKKLKQVKKDLQKSLEKLNENKEKLKKAENTEKFTSAGLMEGSVLTLSLLRGQDFQPSTASGTANPFVVIQCGDKKVSSAVINSNLNPVWNEEFTFPVNSKNEVLSLVVQSKNMFGSSFMGKVSIQLNTLLDQLKHEQFFQLTDEVGNKSQGRIKIELQFIWSKVRFFKDICKEQEKMIQDDQARIEQIKEKLNNLRRPFGYLADLNTRPDIIGTPVSGTVNFEEKVFQRLEELTSVRISIVAESEDYLYYSILAYMILSVFICFARPDFFNVKSI